MVRSDFIAVHRSTLDVNRCPAMPSLVAVVSLSDEGRHRAMSKDVGLCTTMEVWTHHKSPLVLKWRNINGAFRLPSFCIGRRLSTLVFCGTTRVMRTNIHNAQSCCERLASADVDRCTAMKSECTIMVHSDFIAAHRSTNILCTQCRWPRARGRVGKCRLMQSNRSLNAQHNYI